MLGEKKETKLLLHLYLLSDRDLSNKQVNGRKYYISLPTTGNVETCLKDPPLFYCIRRWNGFSCILSWQLICVTYTIHYVS